MSDGEMEKMPQKSQHMTDSTVSLIETLHMSRQNKSILINSDCF
jgi:hypothetical protein